MGFGQRYEGERESEIESGGGPPSETVVGAVADAEGVAPTDLPPLHGAVDTEALDALFRERVPGSVTFDYADHTVLVSGDGDVHVRE